ncbi:MAG: M20/M25/M40 family metallo-hydrolase [Maricaulaceae bacterium]
MLARLLSALGLAALALTCAAPVPAQTPADDPKWGLSAHGVRGHMAFLADDLLEGREAGTRAEQVAGLYIASQFETFGLEPAGTEGYRQPFAVRAARLERGSVALTVRGADDETRFPNGGDIAAYAHAHIAEQRLDDAEVVFAGHGIVAPEFDVDDYAGLDVAGKIVAVISGPAPFLPADEAAHLAGSGVQRATAQARGAIGVLFLWSPANEQRWPFHRFKTVLWNTDLSLAEHAETPQPGDALASAFVRGAAIEALFAGAPRSYATLLGEAETAPVIGFPLQARVDFTRRSVHDDGFEALNVLGLLPGSDPDLAREVIIVSAHFDHVGVGLPVNGDAIYNGAGDNALGVAIMLEIARALAQAEVKPRRSILFAAVGAEEKGLLGSTYLARNPTLAADRLVGNINIDGALTFYDFADLIAWGAEHSTLQRRIETVLDDLGMSLSPDPFPQEAIFTRSDQYSFIREGVPGAFLFNGFHDLAGENVGLAKWRHMTRTFLHKPSDQLGTLPLDWPATAKFADIARRIVLETANHDERPLWFADSTIADRFAPDAPRATR